MHIVRAPSELRTLTDDARRRGMRVGFVPTMGALHEGHLTLVDATAQHGATFRVVSIFVNPTQFGPNEDLARYPRTFDADACACEERGVDVIFAPEPDAMYPTGFRTHVEVAGLTAEFEGAIRPGHFRGVTTVVAKLFALAGPCVAAFGRKDYQQWRVLSRMVDDLALPITMLGVPTVRDTDGLAMSSRNRYLTLPERTRALALSRSLRETVALYGRGERNVPTLEAALRAPLVGAVDAIDYARVVDASTLADLGESARTPPVALIAARVGGTRLLDNAQLEDADDRRALTESGRAQSA